MKNRLMLCVLVGSLFLPMAAEAEVHALIMTIGDYQGGIPKLKGVARDVESARSIAHLLGVKDENILEYHDGQLNYDGMGRAFGELDKRVMTGDKVFIYYSGHGGRQKVSDPEERCAESLVTVDGYGLIDAEMERRLKKLSGRAQKIIAMFDACHSGGVSTRAIGDSEFTPKFWSKDGPNTCEKPVNVLTRGIKLATASEGSGGGNYVYIAAANDNEVSLDQAGKGGMATTAWLDCMSNAKDTDGSGGLTVEEIQACAQQKIDDEMKGAKGFLPQHIKVTGNPRLVMTLAQEKNAPPQDAVSEPAPLPAEPEAELPHAALPGAPEPVATPAIQPPAMQPPSAQPQPVPQMRPSSGAVATLSDIFSGRDDRRTVSIIPAKDKLKIGSDKFGFGIRSSSAGYLYLLMVGSDGQTFDILFPNKLDANNYIQANQTIQFPRPGWELVAQGPEGSDHLLAIVADAPRDFSRLPVANAGPFSVVEAGRTGTRGIQLITASPAPALQSQCSNTHTRTLAVVQACSDAYGAAMAVVKEVE